MSDSPAPELGGLFDFKGRALARAKSRLAAACAAYGLDQSKAATLVDGLATDAGLGCDAVAEVLALRAQAAAKVGGVGAASVLQWMQVIRAIVELFVLVSGMFSADAAD